MSKHWTRKPVRNIEQSMQRAARRLDNKISPAGRAFVEAVKNPGKAYKA